MSEDNIYNFFESLNQLDEALKGWQATKKRQAKFADELVGIISELTYQHFTEKSSYLHLNIQGELNKEALKQSILADKDFKYYGIWIFEELDLITFYFSGDDLPAGRKLFYKKIEYPSFTEEALEEQIKEFEKELNLPLNKGQREMIRQSFKEDAQIEEFYTNFRITIHKALKKSALEYFPNITEISGAGIREIDYMLYTYMLMIKENIMNILEDSVHISVFASV